MLALRHTGIRSARIERRIIGSQRMSKPGYIQIRNSDARAEVENEIIPEWLND